MDETARGARASVTTVAPARPLGGTMTAPAARKIVFVGFTDPSFTESLRKYLLRFVDCSAIERSALEAKLKETGAKPYGIEIEGADVKGADDLALIFPETKKISDSCGAYLRSAGVELESPSGGIPEFILLLLAYSRPRTESSSPANLKLGEPILPDVTKGVISVDLFDMLGDGSIAQNVAAMFAFTKMSVGGKIELVDLYFENAIILRNVRIVEDKTVFIPAAYRSFPIRSVGVADGKRHLESPPMRVERDD